MMYIVKLFTLLELPVLSKLVLGGYLVLFFGIQSNAQSKVQLFAEMYSDKPIRIQLFYTTIDNAYNEKNSAHKLFVSNDTLEPFEIKGEFVDKLGYFRLDFGSIPDEEISVRSLTIQYQNKIYKWDPIDIYYDFKLSYIDVLNLSEDQISFKTKTVNGKCDPYIRLREPIDWGKQKTSYTKTSLKLEYQTDIGREIKLYFISDLQMVWNKKHSYNLSLEGGRQLKMNSIDIYSKGRLRNLRFDIRIDSTQFSVSSLTLNDLSDSLEFDEYKFGNYFSVADGIQKTYRMNRVNYVLINKTSPINTSFIGKDTLIFAKENKHRILKFTISFFVISILLFFINKFAMNENSNYRDERDSQFLWWL